MDIVTKPMRDFPKDKLEELMHARAAGESYAALGRRIGRSGAWVRILLRRECKKLAYGVSRHPERLPYSRAEVRVLLAEWLTTPGAWVQLGRVPE